MCVCVLINHSAAVPPAGRSDLRRGTICCTSSCSAGNTQEHLYWICSHSKNVKFSTSRDSLKINNKQSETSSKLFGYGVEVKSSASRRRRERASETEPLQTKVMLLFCIIVSRLTTNSDINLMSWNCSACVASLPSPGDHLLLQSLLCQAVISRNEPK